MARHTIEIIVSGGLVQEVQNVPDGVRVRILDYDNCRACGGLGYLEASPSCKILGVPKGWVIVERCDTCGMYETDMDAAETEFDEVRSIVCKNGGEHVAARPN